MAYLKTYLKINGTDYSQYVNKLSVTTKQKYTARESANGDLLVKYITAKRNINVGLRPLDASTEKTKTIIAAISGAASMNVKVDFLDPSTGSLSTAYCVIPTNTVEYQFINSNGTLLKAVSFTAEEK